MVKFLRWFLVGLLVFASFVVKLPAQVRVPRGIGVPTSTGLLQGSNISYKGIKSTSGANDSFSYGQLSGFKIGGVNHFLMFGDAVNTYIGHIVSASSATQFDVTEGDTDLMTAGHKIHCQRAARGSGGIVGSKVFPENSVLSSKVVRNVLIAIGSSTTVFTIATGQGTQFSNGMTVHVWRAANSFAPETRVISTVSGDVITLTTALGGMPATNDVFTGPDKIVVSPALGGTPVSGDYCYTEPSNAILEYTDTGSSWKTGSGGTTPDYLTANALSGTTHLDPYNGRRGSWRDTDGLWTFGGAGFISDGLYFNPNTGPNGLAFYTWRDFYNVSGLPDWNFGAIDLTTDTTYGPWRTQNTNSLGTRIGAQGCQYLGPDPTNSATVSCEATISSGIVAYPWGPNKIDGLSWPTATTPSGYTEANLDFGTTRSLMHYYSGGELNASGTPTGTIRSWIYPSGWGYPWETRDFLNPVSEVDPAHFGGVNTWNELSTAVGFLDYRGTHKSGVLMLMNLVGGPGGTTNTDCTTGFHEWYVNAGHATVYLSTVTGSFSDGDAVADSLSGKTGSVEGGGGTTVVNITQSCGGGGCDASFNMTVGGIFSNGSGAHGTITSFIRHDHCFHNCVVGPIGSTGPSLSYVPIRAALAIYDPADLEAVRAGSRADYTPLPIGFVDLNSLGVPTSSAPGGGISGIYQDGTDIYIVTHDTDARIGGLLTSYIIQLGIDDSPVPAPTPEPIPFAIFGLPLAALLTTKRQGK